MSPEIIGYLTGSEEYFTHKRCFDKFCGRDLRDNKKPAKADGIYSTHLFYTTLCDQDCQRLATGL
jgi:hypothetical protein